MVIQSPGNARDKTVKIVFGILIPQKQKRCSGDLPIQQDSRFIEQLLIRQLFQIGLVFPALYFVLNKQFPCTIYRFRIQV